MTEQDKDALRCAETWTINYGLDRDPHSLHELWANGSPPACALALKHAVAHIRLLVAEREKDRDALDKAINVLSAIKAIEDLDLSEYTNLAGQSLAVVVDESISALTERVGEV